MGIKIVSNVEPVEEQEYRNYLESKYGRKLEFLNIEAENEYVNLSYKFQQVPFERIRRITGYLVGTMDHWNDAKSAEEKERVKHQTEASVERLEAI